MTLRTRLILTIAGISLLLVVPAVWAVAQLDRLKEIAATDAQRISRANLSLGRLQTRLAEFDRLQRAYIISSEAESRDGMRNALTNARVHLANLGSDGFGTEVVPTGVVLDSLEHATRRVEALVESGDSEAATEAFDGIRPLFGEATEALDALAAAIAEESRSQLLRAERISDSATTTTLIALAICLMLATTLGLYTTRALIAPIGRLRRSMASVAAGDFLVPGDLPYERGDEVGDLSRSFRSMAQRLAELDRLRAEFMSIATHELKTPINVIAGYAELMQEQLYGDVSDRQDEALTSIREQASVMTNLVNQLLDISRLEAGGVQLDIQPAPVGDLLQRAERAFAALAQQKSITLRFEREPSTPPIINADSDRVRDQLLGNLLSNAFKFTPHGGRISVRTWGERDALWIEVADSGPGIDEGHLPHIFDKFYQIGQEARRQGAGLGLAIAREVVEAHGGQITAASEPGNGARFRFDLPVAGPAPAAPERAGAATGAGTATEPAAAKRA
jgi:signal transduction histidine kinase